MNKIKIEKLPNETGFFGNYGGQYISDELKAEFKKIYDNFIYYKDDKEFNDELNDLLKHYSGRETPIYYAKNLSKKYGADIYLKREDLNHTGAHKINHSLGEVLLAKKMGKTKVIAETGAGQHGVAMATALHINVGIGMMLGLLLGLAMGSSKEKEDESNGSDL